MRELVIAKSRMSVAPHRSSLSMMADESVFLTSDDTDTAVIVVVMEVECISVIGGHVVVIEVVIALVVSKV